MEPKPLIFPPHFRTIQSWNGMQVVRIERCDRDILLHLEGGRFVRLTEDQWATACHPHRYGLDRMAEPRGLKLPAPQPPQAEEPRGMPLHTPSRRELGDHGAPNALNFNTGPTIPNPRLAARVDCDSPEDILAKLQQRRQQNAAQATPREAIIGGDPRAPALLDRARALDPKVAGDIRFRGRLEAFLDLRPMDWMNWGDQATEVITKAAQFAAGTANVLQTANAPKWADETRTAYQKGKPGLFGKKPEFYEQMLRNAEGMLKKLVQDLDAEKRRLDEKLIPLQIDALVLQVCTEGISDPMQVQIVDGRLRTLLTSIQNGINLKVTLEQTQMLVVKQVGDVSQLLTGLIPAWLSANAKS